MARVPGKPKRIRAKKPSLRSRLGKFFSRKGPPTAVPARPGRQTSFPALFQFISREANIFPALLEYSRVSAQKLRLHDNGVPEITGDKKQDLTLLLHCQNMAQLQTEIVGHLTDAGLIRNRHSVADNIELARKKEELLCDEKKRARAILLFGLSSIEAGKKPVIADYKKYKRTNGAQALRLFLTEEARFFPMLVKLRNTLAQIDQLGTAQRDSIAHHGTYIPRLTGDLKTDRELSNQCVQVFTFRNYIRDKIKKARESGYNSPQMKKALRDATRLEKEIDFFKANLRRALLSLGHR